MAGKGEYILDDTDYLIIDLLQRNGRLTMRELGERVSMSAPGVTERVRRLEESGVITGYRAVVDPERLGQSVHGYILVDNIPYQQRDEFYAFVERTPELYMAETVVSGGREAVLRVACADTARLMELNRQFYRFCHSTTAHLTAYPPGKDEPIRGK